MERRAATASASRPIDGVLWLLRYNHTGAPAHRSIAPRAQALLDRLEADPNVVATHDQIRELNRAEFAIHFQYTDRRNPFRPDPWVVDTNDWLWPTLTSLLPVIEQQENEARRMFDALREEQQQWREEQRQWLRRYSDLIRNRWRRERDKRRQGISEQDLKEEKDDEKDDEKAAEPPADQPTVLQMQDAQPPPATPANQESGEQRLILPEHQGEDGPREPPHARGCCSIL